MDVSLAKLFSLENKAAVVTGGAGWLGSALSESLAEAGATVAIVSIRNKSVDEIVGKLENRNLKAFGIVADAMNDTSLRESIDQAAARCGRLDILVHAAFPFQSHSPEEITFDQLDEGFHGGPGAAMVAAQQAAIHMRQTGGGAIVHIASMYGLVSHCPEMYEGLATPLAVTYTAGKAAIIQMTRHLAVYWAKDNIRVNCISPGPFPQPDVPQRMPEFVERIRKKVPLGRIGQPWELKGAAVFLASEASSFVTGQNLIVDGGWTAW
jgi:NAD(P)-dependent dehydrogenase (short-subunit alcohol dehydrogenase family)